MEPSEWNGKPPNAGPSLPRLVERILMQYLLSLSVSYQIRADCCKKVTEFAQACCYKPSTVDRDLLVRELGAGNKRLVARELVPNSRQGLGAGVRARAEAARRLGGLSPPSLLP